jgi:teichoic acid transport system permease protein
MKKRGVFKIKNFLKISLAVARSDFKMNNEGKLFGILWYFINPLIMFFILFLIFSNKKSEILQYPLYLLMGVIMLNFFQNSTVESTRIIGMHGNIIKSVKFKSISLIGALMMENLFMHMIEVIIFIFALFILKASILNIVYYFIVLIFFSFFTFGICLSHL